MVIVIGSSLGAIGAIKALVRAGNRPLVIDVGQLPPAEVQQAALNLSQKPIDSWSSDFRSAFFGSVGKNGSLVPRKAFLGSEYFYGEQSIQTLSVGEISSQLPPYSFALGGFSAGWGGAFLPPHCEDIDSWDLEYAELLRAMRSSISDLEFYEPIDSISTEFPRLGNRQSSARRTSIGQQRLLKFLKGSEHVSEKSTCLVGWSRLLTDFTDTSLKQCRYCGHCSTGCVFGSIYSSAQEIVRLSHEDLIDYRSGLQVMRLSEHSGAARVEAISLVTGETVNFEANRVFVAAGATQTSLIAMRSASIPDNRVTLKKTGGFIQPLLSMRRLELDWPNMNTQSSIFVEFREKELSPYWVHAQVSPPNELVLRRIGYKHDESALSNRLRKIGAEHLVMSIVNLHSDFGPRYVLTSRGLKERGDDTTTKIEFSDQSREMNEKVANFFSGMMRQSGFVAPKKLRQDSISAVGFHLGSSFPMSKNPDKVCSTDMLGRPFGWSRIHFVDSSSLPSIPATTVGLLVMANAYRIAEVSVNQFSAT